MGRPVALGAPATWVRRSAAELVSLVAVLVPAVVMVGRAAAERWVPLFDAAYFTVRSRDVGTTHHPLVGAWSMGSRELRSWINNLGPLQLDLLAPFTKLNPYWGTALGVAATNVAAIVGVWLVARRLLGPGGVVLAMAGTLLLVLDEGSLMLIEARQQLALVLPMWCVLWLAAAAWAGHRWMLPWLVFASSVVVQTHFTYVYQAAAVSIAAAVAVAVRHRNELRRIVWPVGASLVVAIVCWAQPLWDQLAGTGNLGKVADQSGGSDRSVGLSKGLRILAETGFVPPFFIPGSMGDLLRAGDRPSTLAAATALAAWAMVLVGLIVWSRRRSAPSNALASVGLVALVASAYAAVTIPPTEQFGIIAQNYYWAWPVGVFAAVAIVASVARAVLPHLGGRVPVGPAGVKWAATAAVVAGCLPLLAPTNRLPETAVEWSVARHQARPLLDEFAAALQRLTTSGDLSGPVLVDLGGVPHVRYTMLATMQELDVEFRFRPGSTDLSRFGRERCDDGTAAAVIILRGGAEALRLDAPGTLLADVGGLTERQRARAAELAHLFGAALRDGTITVDHAAVRALGGRVPLYLSRARTTPQLARRDLAVFLSDFAASGAVRVPAELAGRLQEWRDLEAVADANRMVIRLRPLPPDRPDLCDEVDPGEDFLQVTGSPIATRTAR